VVAGDAAGLTPQPASRPTCACYVRLQDFGTSKKSQEEIMIGYVTVGTNDLKKAAPFYDKIAAEMGIGRFMGSDTFIAWSSADGGAGLGLTQPFDGKPMSVGNGVMIALAAKDKAQVDRIYKLALSLGGTDEGAPGPRGEGGFYAGYFRDPEGNKLNAFVMG
jgi:predicted lactoylglutathione lyase